MRTRPVTQEFYINYLKKAKECLDSCNDAILRQNWNSAVLCAIHCAISAADAVTVFYLSRRCAGERHAEVIPLLLSINDIDKSNMRKKIQQLSALLDIKNQVEYEEKLMMQNNAETAKKNAERFLSWIKDQLKP